MKKLVIIAIFMVLIFPLSVSAKTINIKAHIASNIKNVNINEVIVSLAMDSEPEGTMEYSLLKSKNYELTVKDFPDDEPVEFAYGSVAVDNKVDITGRYIVRSNGITIKDGVYNVNILVEDKNQTTTTTVIKESNEERKKDNTIAIAIIFLVSITLLITVLIVLIKIKKADNLY
jgi:hypothetical protein